MDDDPGIQADRDISRSFPSDPSSAVAVRQFVREVCAQVLRQEDMDAVVLLTSELVANAAIHTDSERLEVHITVGGGAIRVGVADDDQASPVPHAPAQDETSGRGLQLVDRLSATWGVSDRDGGGKCVWFSVRRMPHMGPRG